MQDLNRKYGRTKDVINDYKSKEDALKETVASLVDRNKKAHEKYGLLRSHAETKLEEASARLDTTKKSKDAEIARLKAQLKKAELNVLSLETKVDQKEKENKELQDISEELISKVGK